MGLPTNIALVHDWLVTMRGGEKCLEVLCELFPNAPLFTLVHKPGSLSPAIESHTIHTSPLQKYPMGISHYQRYLPLFPRMVERFDLSKFDLVISSSHAVAKGVIPRKDAVHICYCHTPMRYIWDQYEDYFGEGRASFPTRLAMRLLRRRLQRWDVNSSERVHRFIANSHNVRKRIERIYNRSAEVIYPPVDTSRFSVSAAAGDYYLIVSALVPYKRIDIAVEAFNRLGEKLVIVGTGVEENRLKGMAKPNIDFAGWVSEEDIRGYYDNCRAVVFPGEEDFGIVPVEAMACGKPVVAYGRGGALETVVEGQTGVFFHDQTPQSLIDAIRRLDTISFDPHRLRTHAEQFDRETYREKMRMYIESMWSELHFLLDKRF